MQAHVRRYGHWRHGYVRPVWTVRGGGERLEQDQPVVCWIVGRQWYLPAWIGWSEAGLSLESHRRSPPVTNTAAAIRHTSADLQER